MKKLTIPAILAATVMVAGAFAFMPVNEASTVHDTTRGGGFDTITLNTDLVLNADAERFVLLDLHDQVASDGGFVVIRTDSTVTCTEIRVVVTAVDGTIEGSEAMAAIGGNDGGEDNEVLCHAHIPSDPDTIFVALAPVAGDTPTIVADSTITTTITTLV